MGATIGEIMELRLPRHAIPARVDNNRFAECGVCRVVIDLEVDALDCGEGRIGWRGVYIAVSQDQSCRCSALTLTPKLGCSGGATGVVNVKWQ